MKNILLIIDIQNGFIANEMTWETLHNIENLLQADIFDSVISTKYVNNPVSPVNERLGREHLLTSEEQKIAGSVESYTDQVVEKRRCSSVNNALVEALKKLNDGTLPEYLFVAGVDTECGVLSSAVDLFERGIRPIVLSSCCGSSGGRSCHHAGILSLYHLIGENNIYDGMIHSKADIEKAVKRIHIFHDYGAAQSGTKEERLVRHLTERGMHIAFAESCTGGLAASRLINAASASHVINGSIVTYSNEVKMKFLHVPEDMICKHGVVSEEVAAAMAEGTARIFESEIGVGISGIAGPGGAVPGKPVGMVCFGFTVNGHTWSRTRYFGNIGRNDVRYASVEFVYDELLHCVETGLI